MEAVERITQRGIGATAKSIAVELDKDRSTIQARLKRLAQAGYLDGMPISDEPLATIIYTVKAQ
jgi:predicted transcriptional regulator